MCEGVWVCVSLARSIVRLTHPHAPPWGAQDAAGAGSAGDAGGASAAVRRCGLLDAVATLAAAAPASSNAAPGRCRAAVLRLLSRLLHRSALSCQVSCLLPASPHVLAVHLAVVAVVQGSLVSGRRQLSHGLSLLKSEAH